MQAECVLSVYQSTIQLGFLIFQLKMVHSMEMEKGSAPKSAP